MSTNEKPQWVPLPAVAPYLQKPSASDRETWVAFYGRVLAKLSDDGDDDPARSMREDIEWTYRDQHPSVKGFHLDALQLAAEERAKPPVDWRDVDKWTREDFIARVEQDKREKRSGSKGSIAERVFLSPTALWRRWERVRHDGEPWPSGNKGPADRR